MGAGARQSDSLDTDREGQPEISNSEDLFGMRERWSFHPSTIFALLPPASPWMLLSVADSCR